MSDGALAGGLSFRDGEHARLWLLDRLDRLEESVGESADLARVAGTLTGDAMTQLESDPLTFRKIAVVNLRDLETELTEHAAQRTTREGFNVPALEQLALATVGREPAHGRDVLEGLARGLRERIEKLSREGNGGHESSQLELDEALAALDRNLDRVVRRWESEPLGFWNRWRRRRRLRKLGLDRMANLPDLALGMADAAREQRAAFERSWGSATTAGITLGMARSYSDVLGWLTHVLQGLATLAKQCAEVARDADNRLERLDGAWREDAPLPDDRNLVTHELLDHVLDQLGVDAAGFLGRSGVQAAELGQGSRKALEAELQRWVEVQLGRLPDPSLKDVLAGFRPNADVAQPLVDLLTDGQPLIRFNDDLHRLFPEGLAAQYYVLAETSDDSIQGPLADACIQVGLPAPLLERPPEPAAPVLSVRVLQLVAGLAWLSEAERLMPMVAVHDEVMAEADESLETKEGLRAALRDTVESESVRPFLPARVIAAMSELRDLKASVVAARGPSDSDDAEGGSAVEATPDAIEPAPEPTAAPEATPTVAAEDARVDTPTPDLEPDEPTKLLLV